MIKVIDSGMVLVFLILSCSFLAYLQINDYKLENFSIFWRGSLFSNSSGRHLFTNKNMDLELVFLQKITVGGINK